MRTSEPAKHRKIAIWGAGGYALVVADAARASGYFEVVGFLDDINPKTRAVSFSEKNVLGGREALETVREKGVLDIALGFGDCAGRLRIGSYLRENAFSVPQIIHPSSIISPDAVIGDGTVVLAGAVIDPGCKIGNYCIVNKNTSIGHGGRIGDGVHICPGVNIAGDVTIGRGVWVGIGTSIIEKLSVGEHSFIGAGSTVMRDIPGGFFALGSPARVLHKISESWSYPMQPER